MNRHGPVWLLALTVALVGCPDETDDTSVDTGSDCDTVTSYTDVDGDGYGDPATASEDCEVPDGAVDNGDDCDDADPGAYPHGAELCDGVDQDCNGIVDDDASDALTWYGDGDGDGYGDPSSTKQACSAPADHVDNDDDCDDDDATIHPDSLWYFDGDGDGYGEASSPAFACEQPWGHVADDTDCDDDVKSTNPGAPELCDGADNDCDDAIDGASCAGFAGTYAGTYESSAEEKVGSTVVNSMKCVDGTSSVVVDLAADPVVSGALSCTYSGGLAAFDGDQTATLEGDVALDGTVTGTLEHRYSSDIIKTYRFTGAVSGDRLLIEETDSMKPHSSSAVPWEVIYTVDASK